nr:MAG TPA: hypothetical protein [Caudoviricetes sp.]DAY94786.1 MAG TPA: hypothetical protein [Caudoviricetes sp.]
MGENPRVRPTDGRILGATRSQLPSRIRHQSD